MLHKKVPHLYMDMQSHMAVQCRKPQFAKTRIGVRTIQMPPMLANVRDRRQARTTAITGTTHSAQAGLCNTTATTKQMELLAPTEEHVLIVCTRAAWHREVVKTPEVATFPSPPASLSPSPSPARGCAAHMLGKTCASSWISQVRAASHPANPQGSGLSRALARTLQRCRARGSTRGAGRTARCCQQHSSSHHSRGGGRCSALCPTRLQSSGATCHRCPQRNVEHHAEATS
mmetsp:Transcript_39027/g.98109  ORF Transcript_39027/g.98109 Transcript_39027/m.98109 type:complete len:231 (-) Transcript_39027:858-1550(-)